MLFIPINLQKQLYHVWDTIINTNCYLFLPWQQSIMRFIPLSSIFGNISVFKELLIFSTKSSIWSFLKDSLKCSEEVIAKYSLWL